jgi:hypothetical protein
VWRAASGGNAARAAVGFGGCSSQFPAGPQSDFHGARFRKPPSHPGRSDFPSPVGSSGMSPEDLPRSQETQALARVRPTASGYISGSTHDDRDTVIPALRPDGEPFLRPPLTESPFAPGRYYLPGGGVPHRLGRRYPAFIAPTGSCAEPTSSRRLGLPLVGRSLQVAARPCWKLVLPDVISAVRVQVPGPVPRHTPPVHAPVSSRRTSASPSR